MHMDQLILTSSWDHSIILWRQTTDESASCLIPLHRFKLKGAVQAMLAMTDGLLVATSDCQISLYPWSIILSHNDNQQFLTSPLSSTKRSIKFIGHQQWITSLIACPSNPNVFYSGSLDGTVMIWDIRHVRSTRHEIQQEQQNNSVNSSSSGCDSAIVMHSIKVGKKITSMLVIKGNGNEYLLIGGESKSILLYSL